MHQLTPLSLFFAFLILPAFSSAQVGHVTEIRIGSYSEDEGKDVYRENVNFIYKDGLLYRAEERGGDRETANPKPKRARTYYYAGGLRYLLVNSVPDFNHDTLIPSSKKTLWFTTDSLLAGMHEMYYDKKSKSYSSAYKTVYSFLANYCFRGYETSQMRSGTWEKFYRCFRDSTQKTGHRQLFQSYKTGSYVTTAHIYFDSIKIVKDKLQFLLRSDETVNTDRIYDKYVFPLKGGFSSCEFWGYDEDVRKFYWNSTYTYACDAYGRPVSGSQWIEEGETMSGTSYKHVVNDKYAFAYEPGTAAMETKRFGSFILVDWCLDTGKPAELLLLDKNLRVQHYNFFPLGQPYFRADAVPHGTYYLLVFSREGHSGGLLTVQL